jgi:hypothetical protein
MKDFEFRAKGQWLGVGLRGCEHGVPIEGVIQPQVPDWGESIRMPAVNRGMTLA